MWRNEVIVFIYGKFRNDRVVSYLKLALNIGVTQKPFESS